MKKLISLIALVICLSGCAELIRIAVVELSGYVASEAIGKSITALDESNKRIEAEEAEKKEKPK
jgi:hypothetical protein